MSDTFSKVEVITGVARRRRFPTDLKLTIVAETMQPGMSISYVSDQGERKPVPQSQGPRPLSSRAGVPRRSDSAGSRKRS
jgi:hypothetical protein